MRDWAFESGDCILLGIAAGQLSHGLSDFMNPHSVCGAIACPPVKADGRGSKIKRTAAGGAPLGGDGDGPWQRMSRVASQQITAISPPEATYAAE
mmetsp:Transcript_11728/g.29679  ORF Transcript_11728/g.29679 Transcript_11728/m.29679 type:complete len:95 (-) Transcript_11728:912-1196(-)